MELSFFSILYLAFFATVIAVPVTKVESDLPTTKADDKIDYRITADVLPSHYNLTLKPFLLKEDGQKQFTFDGEVYITLSTNKSNLKKITLHSRDLKHSKVEFYETAAPNTLLNVKVSEVDSKTNKFTVELENNLKTKTNYTMYFNYTGIMGDDMHGFYRSSYVDDKNNTKWLGSTQFETNHARRAFPCFDEPFFKAKFDLTIVRPKSFKSVSNTRIIRSELIDKHYYKDVYATTPPMSTYILAFLVSEFNERSDGEFLVVARPEYYSQTEYSFNVGRDLLVEFDKYTKLPYYEMGVDKMHLAAIPDFSAGAMENWGLLTYRERSLLYDKESTTLSAKQDIAAVIAHEQAHMWFGDLVTCNWWSYTWLNEGFARYFQYFMTAKVHPEMELDKQFVTSQIQVVFGMDSTNNTNPMSDTTAASPDDLSRMFNSISYNKGGSVIRMIEHAIGEGSFKTSLQNYLDEFKYTNTKPENIFKHWKENWPKNDEKYADGVLKSFTEQVGYPVINVELGADSKSIVLEQKRFLLKPGDGSDGNLLYTVPFTYTTSVEKDFNTTKPKLYVEPKDGKQTFSFAQAIDWVMGNIQETGYYRVNYTAANWHKLHGVLRSDKWGGVHELNRAQYVDDLLAFSRAGGMTYQHSMMCLDYLETETNYLPWTAAFNAFEFLATRLGLDTNNFGNFIIKMSKKAYNLYGFKESEKDTPLEIYTRSKVISWNCKYGHKDCIDQSLKLFRNINTTAVPVNIRGAVYCTAMRDGSTADFDSLHNKLKNEKVPTEQVLIINNLGCVRNKDLVKRYFDIIVSDEIRRQDKSSALTTLYSSNNENVEPVFDLVTENYEALVKSMGSYSSVATVISSIASRFTTKEQQAKLDKFISSNGSKFGTSEDTLKKASNSVKENLDWDTRNLPSVTSYLSGFKNSARSLSISSFTIALVAIVAFMLR